MTTILFYLTLLTSLPAPANLRAAALVPWAEQGAAEACMHTKIPVETRHMIALVGQETRNTFKVRIRGGWKGKYCGPGQVNPEIAHMTCKELQGQPGMMAAGRIFGRFARRKGSLRDAYRKYSGSGAGNYDYADAAIKMSKALNIVPH